MSFIGTFIFLFAYVYRNSDDPLRLIASFAYLGLRILPRVMMIPFPLSLIFTIAMALLLFFSILQMAVSQDGDHMFRIPLVLFGFFLDIYFMPVSFH